MNDSFYLIAAPIAAGLLGFAIKKLRSELDFLGFLLALYFAVRIFVFTRANTLAFTLASAGGMEIRFYLDSLSGLVVLLNSILAFLVWLYSLRAMSKTPKENIYSLYIVAILAASNAIVLCGDLLCLMITWVIFTIFLNALLLIGKKDCATASKTTALTMAVSDLLIISGIVLVFFNNGAKGDFPIEPKVSLGNAQMLLAFLAIMVGAIARVGALPASAWITKNSAVVPASTMALVPASLSRVLGAYLIFRMGYFVFDISGTDIHRYILMAIGAITVIIAAMHSLEQKDVMAVISYYAVAQSGYVLIGIGTGASVAVAGSLYHLLNSVICLSCLYLAVGSVEYRTKTTLFEDLGGIGGKMPLTMLSFIIAALAVSDFPLLNGFYSKWMIYQGVFELPGPTWLWMLLFFVLMFGGVLIFTSVLRTIDLVFLQASRKKLERVYETRFEMVVGTLILSAMCIVFGVLTRQFFLEKLIYPSLPLQVQWFDVWAPFSASSTIVAAILLGTLLFVYRKMRTAAPGMGAIFPEGGSDAKA